MALRKPFLENIHKTAKANSLIAKHFQSHQLLRHVCLAGMFLPRRVPLLEPSLSPKFKFSPFGICASCLSGGSWDNTSLYYMVLESLGEKTTTWLHKMHALSHTSFNTLLLASQNTFFIFSRIIFTPKLRLCPLGTEASSQAGNVEPTC